MTIVLGFATDFCSTYVGAKADESFLRGFKDRIINNGVKHNAIAWANQVFNDRSLNPNGSEEMQLPREMVPSFFTKIFGEADRPNAVAYYSDDKKSADQIEVRRRNGVEWGLVFSRNTNFISDWQFKPSPQSCGEGLYVYVYYYK